MTYLDADNPRLARQAESSQAKLFGQLLQGPTLHLAVDVVRVDPVAAKLLTVCCSDVIGGSSRRRQKFTGWRRQELGAPVLQPADDLHEERLAGRQLGQARLQRGIEARLRLTMQAVGSAPT